MFTVTLLYPHAVTLGIVIVFSKFLQLAWNHAYDKSSLRHLRGPKRASFMFGNMAQLFKSGNGMQLEKWIEEYGDTLRVAGTFPNTNMLLTSDTRAINHILTHDDDYQLPSIFKQVLAELWGELGLLQVQGTQHRRQRRVMNPAFGPVQIRALTNTFFAKSVHLRDLLASEISKYSTAATASVCIDIVPWMDRMTLDTIGLTGFNYDFRSLVAIEHSDQIGREFSTVFQAVQNIPLLDCILRVKIPLLHMIPSVQIRKVQAARKSMTKIGEKLLANAEASILANKKGERIEINDLNGRDLLSLLVKANMSFSTPESHRMSNEEVIAQVPTFLSTAYKTTSVAATWALFVMTQASDVQARLRDELLSIDTDTPSMDQLLALPYLDAVVKEVLRVYPPVPLTVRAAMKDDVVSIEKPYIDKYGTAHDTIRITKGNLLLIPIMLVNRSMELWGPDAREFNPERWSNLPEAVSRVPGIWGNMLTFGGGPRGCIGYRFALVELKAILFTLIRAFKFELSVPPDEICSRIAVVRYPVLRGDPTHRPQLPLLIQPYQKV